MVLNVEAYKKKSVYFIENRFIVSRMFQAIDKYIQSIGTPV